MDEFSDPEPQPSGHLSPPKRRPPTAVGAATPRPPRPSRPRDRLRLPLLSRWARLAVIGLAVGFTAMAVAVVQRDPVLSLSALGGALLGVPILYRRWDDPSAPVLAAPFALAIIAGGLVALARVPAAPGEVPGFEGYALPLLSGAAFGYLIGLTLYGIGAAFLVLFLDQLFRKEAPH